MRKKRIIRVFTVFSGYDSQMLALKRLQKRYPNIEFKLVGWCEIDKDAITVHNCLFPEAEDKHYKDVTQIDWETVSDFDLLTLSSCCQDVSKAGKMLGMKEGSGTRSSLLWYCRQAIEKKKPKYIFFENVKNMVNNGFYADFISWKRTVDRMGYVSTHKVICAGDFDVPQNRERVYMISVRIDVKPTPFRFPEIIESKRTINDLLERNVEEKYYFPSDQVATLLSKLNKDNHELSTKVGTDSQGTLKKQIATPTTKNGSIPTLMASGYHAATVRYFWSTGHYPKPGVLEVWEAKNEKFITEIKITANGEEKVANNNQQLILTTISNLAVNKYLRLRRLTPRECFRFMGVDNHDIDIMLQSGVPEAQLYKQAGNSIVVDVMYHIFKELFN